MLARGNLRALVLSDDLLQAKGIEAAFSGDVDVVVVRDQELSVEQLMFEHDPDMLVLDRGAVRWACALPRARASVPELSAAELELLRLLCLDCSYAEVARKLNVAERTIKRKAPALYEKVGVGGRVELAVWAGRWGFV